MVFKVFGIKVEITFLFAAFVAFVLSLKAPSNLLITIASSLIHESGHLIMLLVSGNKPEIVRFELTGINIIRNQEIRVSHKNEIFISLGGPLVNGFVFFACCICLCFYNYDAVMTFACINLILMTFNLLPVKRLDGGNILYFLLSQKYEIFFSCKILNITSVVFITLIFIWGIYVLVLTGYNISIIIIAIFLTLSLFGDKEY